MHSLNYIKLILTKFNSGSYRVLKIIIIADNKMIIIPCSFFFLPVFCPPLCQYSVVLLKSPSLPFLIPIYI